MFFGQLEPSHFGSRQCTSRGRHRAGDEGDREDETPRQASMKVPPSVGRSLPSTLRVSHGTKTQQDDELTEGGGGGRPYHEALCCLHGPRPGAPPLVKSAGRVRPAAVSSISSVVPRSRSPSAPSTRCRNPRGAETHQVAR